jgi:hypothetical protein
MATILSERSEVTNGSMDKSCWQKCSSISVQAGSLRKLPSDCDSKECSITEYQLNTGLCLFDRVVQGSDQAVDHGMLDFHYID